MSEQIMEIAARVRELRLISEMGVEELAERLGVEAGQYRRYESGEVDIPVSFLLEFGALMGVELSSLLTGGDPKLKVYTLTRAGKGVHVERDPHYQHLSLAGNMAGKIGEPFLVTAQPTGTKQPRSYSSHEGQEFFYVLGGVLLVVIDGRELVLQPGDSLYFNSRYSHGLQAVGEEAATFLAVVMAGPG